MFWRWFARAVPTPECGTYATHCYHSDTGFVPRQEGCQKADKLVFVYTCCRCGAKFYRDVFGW